ncbi:MAG TPA: DUF6249 domain-containing protein [Caulobacteraceae bacterium]|jgi:hypothetical protein
MGNFTAMVVAVTFWVVVAAVVILPVYFRYLERGRMHETLRLAFERGQPIPPELIAAIQSGAVPRRPPGPERDLRNGIILLAVGLGLCGLGYGLWYGLMTVNDISAYITGGCVAGAGAIPGLIGVAYLVLWAMRRGKSVQP